MSNITRWLPLVTIALTTPALAWTPPDYGDAFSALWYDGNAELASYDLVYPRYGELREGTAVAITVTEPFDPKARVKADAIRDDTYNVVKLNLVEDFQTGIYDYNLMTSAFVATQPAHGLPPGSVTKVSFSAQEWCGHAYQQALFSKSHGRIPGVKQDMHSYFEGEADQSETFDHPTDGLSEDALILWARGLAGPALKPGESTEVPLYRSMAVQRLKHKPAAWDKAVLSRESGDMDINIPAASGNDATNVRCDVFTAAVSSDIGDRVYTFHVEQAPPRRLMEMTRDDGYHLKFRAAERLPYWQLHGNADERDLKRIGLDRRDAGEM